MAKRVLHMITEKFQYQSAANSDPKRTMTEKVKSSKKHK